VSQERLARNAAGGEVTGKRLMRASRLHRHDRVSGGVTLLVATVSLSFCTNPMIVSANNGNMTWNVSVRKTFFCTTVVSSNTTASSGGDVVPVQPLFRCRPARSAGYPSKVLINLVDFTLKMLVSLHDLLHLKYRLRPVAATLPALPLFHCHSCTPAALDKRSSRLCNVSPLRLTPDIVVYSLTAAPG
jgi:hypothetical protein